MRSDDTSRLVAAQPFSMSAAATGCSSIGSRSSDQQASATAQLVFGDNDNCIGELIGEVEQKGMSQMFYLMNMARIGVGLQGLALASGANLYALD